VETMTPWAEYYPPSPERDACMIELRKAGKSYDDIAIHFRLSVGSIRAIFRRLKKVGLA